MKLDIPSVQTWLNFIREFFKLYRWLADAFVLDHFVNLHWEKLPEKWREFLSQLTAVQLGEWIITGRVSSRLAHPAPLALQCLQKTVQVLSLNRTFKPRVESASEKAISDKLRKLLNLHVKPKKRHEIWELSFLIQDLSLRCEGIRNIIDVGSGVGHLCRFLSYGLGFNTIGIDSNAELGETARIFRDEVETSLKKLSQNVEKPTLPSADGSVPKNQHLNKFLEAGDKISEEACEFGLVGLHGCGDLGGIVVQNFVQNPQVKFLAFASCCYMKLDKCYPLSNFLKEHPIDLHYVSRELACHAKEVYMERLSDPAQVNKLKTHCYRATLETILVKKGLIREGLQSVKHTHTKEFFEYALRAVEKLTIDLSDAELKSEENDRMLGKWMQVVCFYSLRVSLAPVIETAVLLDRSLYILENGYSCELLPIFDPVKSPRNIVIVGIK